LHSLPDQRPVFYFTPKGEIWPAGVKFSPRGEDPLFAP
jgi:hypothetical protein